MQECCGLRGLGGQAGGDGGRFVLAGARAHYLRDIGARIQHVRIALEPDFSKREIQATATLTLVAHRTISTLELDQRELDIQGVRRLEGEVTRDLAWVEGESTLRIDLTTGELGEVEAGETVSVAIDYRARPRRGLHFVGPDASDPGRPRELWTLNQDENAHYWVPCLDNPEERSTWELIVTAPSDLAALANGERTAMDELAGEGREGFTRTRWRFDTPIPPYLMTLVVGDFAIEETRWRDVPVRYLVPRGFEGDIARNLGRTPEMIEFFSEWTGMPFPDKRYDQVCVHEYPFGGMEHPTQVTLTVRCLRDERAALDSSAEPLVSHELAHQWFGNTVTCREWAHGWLNEGFATFCENLWIEHSKGAEEAAYEMQLTLDSYLGEADGRYRRPLVERRYHQAIDLFDSHLYEKGCLVLNLLRRTLGREDFQRGVAAWLRERKGQAVESSEFRRILGETTGRRLEQFFEEWVEGPGHVELKAACEWNAEDKLLTLRLEQTQDPAEAREAFRLELDLECEVNGEWLRRTITMAERHQSFQLAFESEPTILSIDPQGALLGSLDWQPGEARLLRQLAGDHRVIGRVRAARSLAGSSSWKALEGLRAALVGDSFHGVAAEAAKALGKIGSPTAREALLTALASATHPKTRKAIVIALGGFRGDRAAADVVAGLLESGDASQFVEAEAAKALGALGFKDHAATLITALETKDSWHDAVRGACLHGLGRLEDPEQLERLLEWTAVNHPFDARIGACRGLEALAKVSPPHIRTQVVRRFKELADGDANFRVQIHAIHALGRLGDGAATGTLTALEADDHDGRVRRACREALAKIRAKKGADKRLVELERKVDEERRKRLAVEEEVQRLKLRLDEHFRSAGGQV